MAAETVQLVNRQDGAPPVAYEAPAAVNSIEPVYRAKYEKRVVHYLANSEIYSGAGIYEEWSVTILERNKTYLKNVGMVVRLNEQNTVPQNDHITMDLTTDPTIAEDALLIIQHGTSIEDLPLPKKVQWILSKLNT